MAHLYAPNLYHHLRIGEWAAAFPSSWLHAPRGLARKRADLRIDRVHNVAPEPAFAGVVDERCIDGFRLEESVLFHRQARTLVVADLVHNIGRPQHRWAKLCWRFRSTASSSGTGSPSPQGVERQSQRLTPGWGRPVGETTGAEEVAYARATQGAGISSVPCGIREPALHSV